MSVQMQSIRSARLSAACILLGISCAAALRLHDDSKPERREGVTFMVNAIERNVNILEVKVAHLVENSNYNFDSRIVVLDTAGEQPSQTLLSSVHNLTKRGLVDSYKVVDYSDAYWKKAQDLLGKRANRTIGHSGNLVYYYMLQSCPTKYLVHFDLDMVMYNAPGYSWVREGVQLLKEDSSSFYLTSPRHGSTGEPSKRYTCENTGQQATWVAMRNYLMDVGKAFEALHEAGTAKMAGPKNFCGQDKRTMENFLSCTICEMHQKGGGDNLDRLDIMDGTKNYALHFPEMTRCGPEIADWVIEHMVNKNLSLSVPPGFQAQCLHNWLVTAEAWAKADKFNMTKSVPKKCSHDVVLEGLDVDDGYCSNEEAMQQLAKLRPFLS